MSDNASPVVTVRAGSSDASILRRVVTEAQAAVLCGISVVHLRRLRKAGKGPRHLMLGERRIGYEVAEIEAWLDSRTVGAPLAA